MLLREQKNGHLLSLLELTYILSSLRHGDSIMAFGEQVQEAKDQIP